MTLLATAWTSEPRSDADKIDAIRAYLTDAGRAMFEAELESAPPDEQPAVVAAWYDTMRVVTQPGFAANQQRLAALRDQAPRLTRADLHAELDSA